MPIDTDPSVPGPARRSSSLPLLIGLVAALHVAGFIALWTYVMEDAFITFRYALHLSQGLGPVWNLDSPVLRNVEGFSSLLHLLILAAAHAATGLDMALLGKFVGLAFGLGLIASVGRQSARDGLSTGAALLALTFACSVPMLMASTSGMETTLAVWLTWLSAIACVRLLESSAHDASPYPLVLLTLLATLARPEFGAIAVVWFALVGWRRQDLRHRLAIAVVAAFILPGLAVTTWRWLTFHDVVPNAFWVKQRVPGSGTMYVWRFVVMCVLPYALIVAPGLQRLWAERRDRVLVVGASVLISCVYFTTTRPFMGWWFRYLLAQVPLMAWLAAQAWDLSADRRSAAWTRGMRMAGVVALVVIGLGQIPPLLYYVPFRHADDVRFDELGRRLRPLAAPDRSFAYFDVGRLPYASEWNVVDVVGLATHKADLRGDCANRTDLILRSASDKDGEKAEGNPCPRLYDKLIDLDWMVLQPEDRRTMMRVWARKDIAYGDALRAAVTAGWPEPFVWKDGWLADYDARVGWWFGR